MDARSHWTADNEIDKNRQQQQQHYDADICTHQGCFLSHCSHGASCTQEVDEADIKFDQQCAECVLGFEQLPVIQQQQQQQVATCDARATTTTPAEAACWTCRWCDLEWNTSAEDTCASCGEHRYTDNDSESSGAGKMMVSPRNAAVVDSDSDTSDTNVSSSSADIRVYSAVGERKLFLQQQQQAPSQTRLRI